MSDTSTIPFSLLLLLAVACGDATPPPAPAGGGASSAAPAPESDHGAETEVGTVRVGAREFRVVQLGELVPGKEGAFEVHGAGATPDVRGLRAYLWVESDDGAQVSAPEKGLPGGDRLHFHVTPRQGTAPVRVVLRVRGDDGDERGSLPLPNPPSAAAPADRAESAPAGEPHAVLAGGWTQQLDDATEDSPASRFVIDADTVEATQGPNACLWVPVVADGNYRLSATVTHLDSGLHPHGAGLTFGGTDVHGTAQRYTYFLVRGDRHFLIKTRAGEDTADVVPWTEHEAVAAEDDEGLMENRLAVEVRGAEVVFSINGTEVHRGARDDLPSDGRIGLRLVHDLHVRFTVPVVERLD